jgi:hypothetical protein
MTNEQINDGGQAFPMSFGYESENYSGMSLRDWFAGQALAGMLANAGGNRELHKQSLAEISYAQADAMLVARKDGAK